LLLLFLSGDCFFSNNSSQTERKSSFSHKTDEGNLNITPWSQNIIRFSLTDSIESKTTDAVIMKPSDVQFSMVERGNIVILKTDSVKVTVNKKTLKVDFFDSDNQSIAGLTDLLKEMIQQDCL
jgi:hypothetical protein